jgi:aminoglycoside phosphotransferase (APT) family kinase protein
VSSAEAVLAAATREVDLVPASIEPLATGIEFHVYRATSRSHGTVVLRFPNQAFFGIPGVRVSARDVLEQEARITAHLAPRGFPVAAPIRLISTDPGTCGLVSRFIASDGSSPDWRAFGRCLARLHAEPPPEFSPVDQEGLPVGLALGRRLMEHYDQLREEQPGLPPLPPARTIEAALAEPPDSPRLLHMDVRVQNLLCCGGELHGWLDWSAALLGEPALELARLSEFARIEENGIDEPSVLAGYAECGELPSPDERREVLYRLDAAAMLAWVFRHVAPNRDLESSTVARVRDLVREL